MIIVFEDDAIIAMVEGVDKFEVHQKGRLTYSKSDVEGTVEIPDTVGDTYLSVFTDTGTKILYREFSYNSEVTNNDY